VANTTWDKKKATYRDSKGKEIPYKAVRSSIESVSDHTKTRLRELTQSFIDKKIDLPSWATQSEQLIRKSLISSGQIASGGKSQLDASLNGRLGNLVKFHLNKFRSMGLSRERGEVSDLELLARSEMYGEASISTFEAMRLQVMIDAGYTEGMRVLGASQHCSDCPPLAGKWVKIEEVRPIGTTQCLTRCRCQILYR
jgi:hypothetical protein